MRYILALLLTTAHAAPTAHLIEGGIRFEGVRIRDRGADGRCRVRTESGACQKKVTCVTAIYNACGYSFGSPMDDPIFPGMDGSILVGNDGFTLMFTKKIEPETIQCIMDVGLLCE